MSRQYAPYSTTRDSYSGSGYRSAEPTDPEADQQPGYLSDRERRRAARRGAGYGRVPRATYANYDTYDPAYDEVVYDDEADTDYADYEFPADYHEPLDRRWIWVAGVAGVILMVAVICTGVILGGGDSGTVTAGATTSADADPTAQPSATAAPRRRFAWPTMPEFTLGVP